MDYKTERTEPNEISLQVCKELLDKMQKEHYFGDLVTVFKNGKVVFIRKVQCYQPKDEKYLLAK